MRTSNPILKVLSVNKTLSIMMRRGFLYDRCTCKYHVLKVNDQRFEKRKGQ
jgi:hypothetical protein